MFFKCFFLGSSNYSLFFLYIILNNIFYKIFYIGGDNFYYYNLIKIFCLKKNFLFIQIKSIFFYNNFLKYNLYYFLKLKYLNFNIFITIDYGFFFSLFFIRFSEYGILNFHFSLLPFYKGFCPLMFIVNKNIYSGLSFLYLNYFIDSGSIILNFKKNFFSLFFLKKIKFNLFFKIEILFSLKKTFYFFIKKKYFYNLKQLINLNYFINKKIK